jgi:hypothetical protein
MKRAIESDADVTVLLPGSAVPVPLASLANRLRSAYAIRALLPSIGDGISIGESDIAGAGRGLFAMRDFAEGEIVTFYDGPVIEKPARTWQVPARFRTHTRALYMGRMLIVGNFGHFNEVRPGTGGGAFINAEYGTDRVPNVEFYHIDVPGREFIQHPENRVMAIRALRSIAAGEEFVISYGRKYGEVSAQNVDDPDAQIRVLWFPNGAVVDYPLEDDTQVQLVLLPPFGSEPIVCEPAQKKCRLVPIPLTPQRACLVCREPTETVCGSCGVAYFCSNECLLAESTQHTRELCKAIARMQHDTVF